MCHEGNENLLCLLYSESGHLGRTAGFLAAFASAAAAVYSGISYYLGFGILPFLDSPKTPPAGPERRCQGALAVAPYIAGACIFITLNWGSYIYATTRGFILQASLAYFINPIVVVFFGGLIFQEKLRPIQKLSIFVAGLGLALAFFIYGVVPWLSFIICLTWATYSMIKKKVVLDSQVSVFIESFSMVPLALAFILFSEANGIGAAGIFNGWQWLLLPATGVVTAVPMMLFSAGVKGIPMTTGGILMYFSPSITLVIGVLSGEVITEPLLLTFCFAWVAVALYMYGIYQTIHRLRQRT